MSPEFDVDSEGIETSADDTANRMPTAQPGFTGPSTETTDGDTQTPASNASTGPAADAERDSSGVAYDPSIHAKGRDGKGVRTADGLWRKRRQSRVGKVASGTAISVSPAADPNTPAPLTPEQIAQAHACGEMMAQTMFSVSQAFGGPDYAPRKQPDEYGLMKGAWGNYFVAKGVTDIPPGLMLVSVIGSYYGARFVDKETFPAAEGRVTRLKQWAAAKIVAYRDRRAAKKAAKQAERTDDARTDSRDDGQR